MASQFNWDKQQGLFELYVTSPAPISAILIGMSLGGILGTAPSAITLAIIGWILFAPPANPLWPLVALTFALTLASLYSMGMALSSLYLVYGREADSVNEALHEPVSFLSGVYFPSSLAFPAVLQAIVLIIPLAVGMDALQRTLFSLNSNGVTDLTPVYRDILLLAIMGITLLFAASKALKILGEKRSPGGHHCGKAKMSYTRSVIASIRVGWSRDFGWTNPFLGFSLKTVAPIASTMTAVTVLYIGFRNGTSIASSQFPMLLGYILIGATLYAHISAYS